jgi:hypothetical protein
MNRSIMSSLSSDLSAIYSPQPLTTADLNTIERAKIAIGGAPLGDLTPESLQKLQRCMLGMLDISSNRLSTATWILEKLTLNTAQIFLDILQACQYAKSSGADRPVEVNLSEGATPVEASSRDPRIATLSQDGNFSITVKSVGFCRVSGEQNRHLQSSHVIPFSSEGDSRKIDCYCDLVKAMFGREAFEVLVANVMNGEPNTDRNVNRLDNGIPLSPGCHESWDTMDFYLSVDWSSYNDRTGEVRLVFASVFGIFHLQVLVQRAFSMARTTDIQHCKLLGRTAPGNTSGEKLADDGRWQRNSFSTYQLSIERRRKGAT